MKWADEIEKKTNVRKPNLSKQKTKRKCKSTGFSPISVGLRSNEGNFGKEYSK